MPLMVILDAAPEGFAAPLIWQEARHGRILVNKDENDGRHLVVAVASLRFRVWIRSLKPDQPLSFNIVGDRYFDARIAVAQGFHDGIIGKRTQRRLAFLSPGPSERWRLVQWLRLLDGLDQGATSREIASILVMGGAGYHSAAEWDASSERKRVSRWIRQAIAMRDGGYHQLLAGE